MKRWEANTTASNSTAVGYKAGYNSTGRRNAFFGSEAGESNTSGESNTYIGRQAGQLMTTGNNNTILGRYNGNQGGLDIRTSSNNIVLSDGDGNPRLLIDSSGNVGIGATSPSAKLNVVANGRFDNSAATPVRLHINNSGSNDYASIYADTTSAYKNLVLNPNGGNVSGG
jgi:trimeric autotransporter adhesin